MISTKRFASRLQHPSRDALLPPQDKKARLALAPPCLPFQRTRPTTLHVVGLDELSGRCDLLQILGAQDKAQHLMDAFLKHFR
jgi:hypothetical protein